MIENLVCHQDIDDMIDKWIELPRKTRKRKEYSPKDNCISRVSQNGEKLYTMCEMDPLQRLPHTYKGLLERKPNNNALLYYIVPSVDGKKHGFGEIHFGGVHDGLVYSTHWNNDIPAKQGFLYNKNTSEVLCLINGSEVTLFDDTTGPRWEVIDKDNGERWEGLSFKGSPCGVGEYYDSDNHLIYSGLCVNYFWEGYGRSYFPAETEDHRPSLACEGMWCHGSLVGDGDRYDVRGNHLPKGLLLNGRIYKTRLVLAGARDLSLTHCFLEELVIGSNSLNSVRTINLELFRLLRSFVVGDNSCSQCTRLLISHNSELESIVIGDYSFSSYGNAIDLLLSESASIVAQNKSVSIRDVAKLREIRIGFGAFSDFCGFAIADAPRLTTLLFGRVRGAEASLRYSCCFFYCQELCLRRLPDLREVEIGDFSFYHTSSVLFYRLPSLTSIRVGQACFFRSLGRQGRLELFQLPSLTSFDCSKQAFASVFSIVLHRRVWRSP